MCVWPVWILPPRSDSHRHTNKNRGCPLQADTLCFVKDIRVSFTMCTERDTCVIVDILLTLQQTKGFGKDHSN